MAKNYLSIYAKSFNWAGFFLPKKIYQKCSHLYDFCRSLDDIADQELSLDIKIEQFNEFKNNFKNKNFDNPIIKNMHQLINNFGISVKIVYDLFDGVESDLKNKVIINSKKELLIYSYRVAGTVGLMMAKIINVKIENSLKSAIDLGIAMQLTNIMRDLQEDSERDRIYIPQDEMAQFGYKETDMLKGQINDNFRQLMQFQVERARSYFDSGINLLDFLQDDAIGCTAILHKLYSRILDRIEKKEYDVFSNRVSLTGFEKIMIMSRFFLISIKNKINITNR